jgi:hypothetical protein
MESGDQILRYAQEGKIIVLTSVALSVTNLFYYRFYCRFAASIAKYNHG